jgi:hypothetical protein
MGTSDTETRAPVRPAGPTGRIPWSSRLIQEWAGIKYSHATVLYELRLGPTEKHLVNVQVTPALEAMLRLSNWYADGVILAPEENLIIEAKMDPNPSAVGQVLFYQRLVYATPALGAYNSRPYYPVVLFAEDDSEITPWARGLGVRVEVYTPSWIGQYLQAVQFRNRTTVPKIPGEG